MRILFLSNYYPPFARGGYEQWCQEVATELADRGHQVGVLTSRSPEGAVLRDDNNLQIFRLLHLEVDGGLADTVLRLLKDRDWLEQENLAHLRKLAAEFNPDLAFIWGMWNVPRSVPALAEQLLPGRVAYYLCDYWLSLPNAYIQRWQDSSRRKLAQLTKRLLSKTFLAQLEQETPIRLVLEHPICVSRAVRELLVQAGVPVSHAQVIYGGTQVEEFMALAAKDRCKQANKLRLLYVGRLTADKGVHTVIQAVALVLKSREKCSVALDIYGEGHPDYEAELKSLVRQNHLEQVVFFRGSVPRAEIPAILAQHDVLIFPSEWEEPFARTVLEAMAAGLVVIGTTTGGTGEILIERETGLTFPASDAEGLAQQILVLGDDPELSQRLAKAGQQRIVNQFSFQRMVDEIEATLQKITVSNREEV